MQRIRFIALMLVALAAGCSTTDSRANVALGVGHPADPGAPEAPAYARSNALDGAPARAPAAHAHGGSQPAKSEQVFSCPMHPEIVAGAPGRCPLCGMQLVPKAEQP